MSDLIDVPQIQRALSKTRSDDFLYELLPVVLRSRDQEVGRALQALMRILQQEHRALQDNIAQLYEDWFIATCEEWVVPYLGEDIGVVGLQEVRGSLYSQRSRVAHTMAYRRAKGTLATLPRAIRDATGWGVFALAYYERLGLTQSLQHLRPNLGRLVDVRDTAALDDLERPWTTTARTISVRGRADDEQVPVEGGLAAPSRPMSFNLPVIGLFLYRLVAYPVEERDAARVDDTRSRFTFHPLGFDAPLFCVPRTEPDHFRTPTKWSLARPLTRDELKRRLRALPAEDPNAPPIPFEVRLRHKGGAPSWERIKPGAMIAADLSAWDVELGADNHAAIDPELGRILLSAAMAADCDGLMVSYAYGFAGDFGGGPYERGRQWSFDGTSRPPLFVAKVGRRFRDSDARREYASVESALAAWETCDQHGIIHFVDSATYDAPGGGWRVAPSVPRDLTLAAGVGAAPVLRGHLKISDGDVSERVHSRAETQVTLDGLTLEGVVELLHPVDVHVQDCTLIPSEFREEMCSIRTPDSWPAPGRIIVHKSITGPLKVASPATVSLTDSIIDGGQPDRLALEMSAERPGGSKDADADATLERCTVLGRTRVPSLLASSCLFCAPLEVTITRTGGISYSYVPEGSRTPALRVCQPQSAMAGVVDPQQREALRLRLLPAFTSTRFGHPGYAQLAHTAAPELLAGGGGGQEMGAFSRLCAPQRMAALLDIVSEYEPEDLTTSIVFMT